jgi:hypothetical protein
MNFIPNESPSKMGFIDTKQQALWELSYVERSKIVEFCSIQLLYRVVNFITNFIPNESSSKAEFRDITGHS